MANYNSNQLDSLFSALSDPTRRKMLERLSARPMSIGELSEPFVMSKPSISKHIKVLENAGLIKRKVEGRIHRCQLEPEKLKDGYNWLAFYTRFWNEKFDLLEEYLKK